MQTFLTLRLGYDKEINIPVEHASTFLKIMADSVTMKREYVGGIVGYSSRVTTPKERAEFFDISYTELPDSMSLHPNAVWEDIQAQLTEAESILHKYEHVIKAAEELRPADDSENDSPF